MSHDFPPMGGGAAQRFASFARHLPAHGFDPVVICAQPPEASRSTPTIGESLLDGLPPSEDIVRLPAMRAQVASGRDHRSLTRAIAPAQEIAWTRRAIDAAIFAARRHDAEAIVVTASPWTLAAHVGELRRRADRPVILDLRDPWTIDGWRVHATPMHRWIDHTLMRRSLHVADVIIANCPAAADAYRAIGNRRPDAVVTIPNGFEAVDFPARRRSVRTVRLVDPSEPFRIVHMGTLSDPDPRSARRPRWRAAPGARIDPTWRSARALLRAAGLVRRRAPRLLERLSIELVGVVHPHHETIIQEEQLQGIVRVEDAVGHDQRVRRLSNADAVFVPHHAMLDGQPALTVPETLCEAVATGRPVLAPLPAGDGRRLVRLAGGDSRVVDPDDVNGVAEILESWLQGAAEGWRPEGACRELLAAFRADRLTERLSRTLDAVSRRGSIPLDDPWLEIADAVSGHDGSGRLPDEHPGPARHAA